MERPAGTIEGGSTAVGKRPALYPIEVSIGGRVYRSTRTHGELFIKSARANLDNVGAPLTVLAHSGGVDLLHITRETPVAVLDLSDGVPKALWGSPDQVSPTPAPTPATASVDRSDEHLSFTISRNGSAMNTVRERILAAAYELFTHHAVHDVTLEQVRKDAGVSEAELAQEFESVDALAEQCLERRELEWTIGIVRAGARARSESPEGRLLAIFEVFDEWFHRDDYEACTFINVLLEMGREHPLGRASVEHLVFIRALVANLATEAGLRDPEEFAYSWHILMKGAIINAAEGDDKAALRAQAMGRDLIQRHRTVSTDTGSYRLDPRWALG
jgi:AcrR family transcriptional regulator